MKSRTLLNGIKALALFLSACAALTAHAGTALSDVPLFATTGVPGNLVLALSVEFPTAVTAEDRSSYSATTKYLGYFDPLKCYVYTIDSSAGGNGSYFAPSGATGTNYSCSGKWSGNFMNWATMQAVDPFRWALTGGYRNIDTTTTTILEKAWAPSNQGSPSNNFPHKTISNSGSFSVSQVTPFSESLFNMQVLRCGNTMLFRRTSTAFTNDSACPSSTAWDGVVSTAAAATVYSVQVRVQVCVAGSLEANCAPYGSNAKPQGLIQQYSNKIRYSAFGYLNDPAPTGGSMLRDGGVLRARMKYVGPTQPVPGSTAITNGNAEWSSTTGVFVTNPDPTDATNSSETGSVVANSGVINYLNQFGRSAQAYKYYDPVSELYYAATRYLRGLSNVTEYSDLTKFNGTTSTLANRTAMKDGFPVISTWTDPILYSCQKNFVLGIGDTNSNQDKSLKG
jgi:type IV pilus assembly protein PilY1